VWEELLLVRTLQKQVLPDNPQAPVDCDASQVHSQYLDRLEIGSGNTPEDGFTHLDVNPQSPHVEIVGDIRSIFSVDYDISQYPDLVYLKDIQGVFSEIRAVHVVEHVQWIYQKAMFEWFFRLLKDGGRLTVQTPDLEWIAKSYIKNKRKKRFPETDHPDLSLPKDFTAWANFKLYSGCSKGDYHHCSYDRDWLKQVMVAAGFRTSIHRRGGTLHATGNKPGVKLGRTINDYYQS